MIGTARIARPTACEEQVCQRCIARVVVCIGDVRATEAVHRITPIGFSPCSLCEVHWCHLKRLLRQTDDAHNRAFL